MRFDSAFLALLETMEEEARMLKFGMISDQKLSWIMLPAAVENNLQFGEQLDENNLDRLDALLE